MAWHSGQYSLHILRKGGDFRFWAVDPDMDQCIYLEQTTVVKPGELIPREGFRGPAPLVLTIEEARDRWRSSISSSWTYLGDGFVPGMATKRVRQWGQVVEAHCEGAQAMKILRQEWRSKYDPNSAGFNHRASSESIATDFDELEEEDYRYLIEMREDRDIIESGDFDNLWNEEGRFEDETYRYLSGDD